MNNHFVAFIPPIIGVEDEFNTFRLGGFYAKHLTPGDEVYLLNEKDKIVFGRARVENIHEGRFGELLLIHAAKNHTQLANDSTRAPETLFAVMRKIYGPHIALPNKKAVVIYLKRLE